MIQLLALAVRFLSCRDDLVLQDLVVADVLPHDVGHRRGNQAEVQLDLNPGGKEQ